MKKLYLLLSLLISFNTQALEASNLSLVEQNLNQYISTHEKEQLSSLEQLVNINSGTMNIDGVNKVGEILKTQFEQIGFKTYWIAEPAKMNRAGTLIAKRSGKKGKRLLLIGHLDTVFPENSPFQRFKIDGKTATGPGIIDDKGGDVVILSALKALEEIHALEDANITVILTGDEEDSGKPTSISRKPLIEAAHHSDIALDFEWEFTKDTATIARRGVTSWMIKTSGNEKHSSEIFQKNAGYGAIFELTRILNEMKTQLATEKYLTFSPSLILGGNTIQYNKNKGQGMIYGKGNVIAKTAMAKGDLRFLTEEQKIKAESKITNIVAQHLPGTSANITFEDGIPAMPPTEANLALLNKYSAISNRLGYGKIKALNPGLRGAGDISHVANIVSACLAGLGPLGTGAHSDLETLEISSVTMQTKRAALLIYQLINE